MKATIYCRATDKGIHTFYLRSEGCDYYLFRQNYRRGVDEYFKGGVILVETDFTIKELKLKIKPLTKKWNIKNL